MAVSLFFTVQDGDSDTSTITVYFPTAAIASNALAVANAFAAVINPLVNGGLKTCGITVELDISSLWGPTSALIADVQEQAQFLFRVVGGFPKLMNLPTFIETFFTGAGADKTVDMTAPEVVAFVGAMEDGLTVSSVLYAPSDYRNADILSTESAVQHWGRNRA